MYICSICNCFGGPSLASIVRHIGEIHRHDPGLQIRCGISQCPQTYKNFESFRSHVYRKHRDELHPVTRTTTNSPLLGSEVYTDEEQLVPLQSVTPDPQVICAKFVLKAREEYRISQASLNKIIGDLRGMWMLSLEVLKKKIEPLCRSLLPDDSDAILECFNGHFPLTGLETEYMQFKFYKENFDYLVSFHNIIRGLY